MASRSAGRALILGSLFSGSNARHSSRQGPWLPFLLRKLGLYARTYAQRELCICLLNESEVFL